MKKHDNIDIPGWKTTICNRCGFRVGCAVYSLPGTDVTQAYLADCHERRMLADRKPRRVKRD